MPRLFDFYGRTVSEFFNAYTGDLTDLVKMFEKLEAEGTLKDGIDAMSNKMLQFTSVHFACMGGSNVGVVRELESQGFDLFKKDQLERMPIHVAANAGKYDLVRFLVSRFQSAKYKARNLSILAKDLEERSVLHHISAFGSSEGEKAKDAELAKTLQLLLDQYPDDTARTEALLDKDLYGNTPLELAIANGYAAADSEFVKVLKKYGVTDEQLSVTKEIDFDLRDFYGRTILSMNAFAGSVDVVKAELAKDGVDPNEANNQFGERAPLHLALGGVAPIETLEAIMAHSQTLILQKDHDQATALHYAANTGKLAHAEMLFNGVKVMVREEEVIRNAFPLDYINLQDVNGNTALHVLTLAGSNAAQRVQVLELLHKKGLDFTITNKAGLTAFELAEVRGNKVVVDAFKALQEKLAAALLVESEQQPVIVSVTETVVAEGNKPLTSFADMMRSLEPVAKNDPVIVTTETGNDLTGLVTETGISETGNDLTGLVTETGNDDTRGLTETGNDPAPALASPAPITPVKQVAGAATTPKVLTFSDLMKPRSPHTEPAAKKPAAAGMVTMPTEVTNVTAPVVVVPPPAVDAANVDVRQAPPAAQGSPKNLPV